MSNENPLTKSTKLISNDLMGSYNKRTNNLSDSFVDELNQSKFSVNNTNFSDNSKVNTFVNDFLFEAKSLNPKAISALETKDEVINLKAKSAEAFDPITGEPLQWKQNNIAFLESMKKRHLNALHEYNETIQGLSEALDTKAHEAALFLQNGLKNFHRRAEKRLSRLEENYGKLVNYPEKIIDEEWTEIHSILLQRGNNLQTALNAFYKIEIVRVEESQVALTSLVDSLERAAYIETFRSHQIVEEKRVEMNILLKNNRNAHFILIHKLKKFNEGLITSFRERWEDVRRKYRILRHQFIVNELKNLINTSYEYPISVVNGFSSIKTAQTRLTAERMDLIDSLFAIDGFADLASAYAVGGAPPSMPGTPLTATTGGIIRDNNNRQKSRTSGKKNSNLGQNYTSQSGMPSSTTQMFNYATHVTTVMNQLVCHSEKCHQEFESIRSEIKAEINRLKTEALGHCQTTENEISSLNAETEWSYDATENSVSGEGHVLSSPDSSAGKVDGDGTAQKVIMAKTASEFVDHTGRKLLFRYTDRMEGILEKTLKKAIDMEDAQHFGAVNVCDFLLTLDKTVGELVRALEKKTNAHIQSIDTTAIKHDEEVKMKETVIKAQESLVAEAPTLDAVDSLQDETFSMIDSLEKCYKDFASHFSNLHKAWPLTLQEFFNSAVATLAMNFEMRSHEDMEAERKKKEEESTTNLAQDGKKSATALKASPKKGTLNQIQEETQETKYDTWMDTNAHQFVVFKSIAEIVKNLLPSPPPLKSEEEIAAEAELLLKQQMEAAAKSKPKSKKDASSKNAPVKEPPAAIPSTPEPEFPEFPPGQPTMLEAKIDQHSLIELMEIIRDRCFTGLCRLEDISVDAAMVHSQMATASTARQLDFRLRKHENLKGTMKLEVLQPRRRAMHAHRHSLDSTLCSIIKSIADQEEMVMKAEAEINEKLDKYVQDVKKTQDGLPSLHVLAPLQAAGSSVKDLSRQLHAISRSPLNVIHVNATKSIASCRALANTFVTNAEAEADYSEDELALFKNELESLEEGLELKAEQRLQLGQDLNNLINSTIEKSSSQFESVLSEIIEELSAAEGLGQKHGAPRRAAQEAFHSLVSHYETFFEKSRLVCADLVRTSGRCYRDSSLKCCDTPFEDLAPTSLNPYSARIHPHFQHSNLAPRQGAFPPILNLLRKSSSSSKEQTEKSNSESQTAHNNHTTPTDSNAVSVAEQSDNDVNSHLASTLTNLQHILTPFSRPLPVGVALALPLNGKDVLTANDLPCCPLDPLRILYGDAASTHAGRGANFLEELAAPPADPGLLDLTRTSLPFRPGHLLSVSGASNPGDREGLNASIDNNNAIVDYSDPLYWRAPLTSGENSLLHHIQMPSHVRAPLPLSNSQFCDAVNAASAGNIGSNKGAAAKAAPKGSKDALPLKSPPRSPSSALDVNKSEMVEISEAAKLRTQAVSLVQSLIIAARQLDSLKPEKAADLVANENLISRLETFCDSFLFPKDASSSTGDSTILPPSLPSSVLLFASDGGDSSSASQLPLDSATVEDELKRLKHEVQLLSIESRMRHDQLVSVGGRLIHSSKPNSASSSDNKEKKLDSTDELCSLPFKNAVTAIATSASAKFATGNGGKGGAAALPPFMDRFLKHLAESSASKRDRLSAKLRDLSDFLIAPRGPLGCAAVACFADIQARLWVNLTETLEYSEKELKRECHRLREIRNQHEKLIQTDTSLVNLNMVSKLNKLCDDEKKRTQEARNIIQTTREKMRASLCKTIANAKYSFPVLFEFFVKLIDVIPARDSFSPLPLEYIPPPTRSSFKYRLVSGSSTASASTTTSTKLPPIPATKAKAKAAPLPTPTTSSRTTSFTFEGLNLDNLVIENIQKWKPIKSNATITTEVQVPSNSPTKAAPKAKAKAQIVEPVPVEDGLRGITSNMETPNVLIIHKVLFKARNDGFLSFAAKIKVESSRRLAQLEEQEILEDRREKKWKRMLRQLGSNTHAVEDYSDDEEEKENNQASTPKK